MFNFHISSDASEVMDGSDVGADGEGHLGGMGSSIEGSCTVSYIMLAVVIVVMGIGISYVTLQGTKN